MQTTIKFLQDLGAKPSISEENGIALLRNTDLTVFSPGISSGGFAEIRMALGNKDRKVIATTIDKEGLNFSIKNIKELGLENQIETKVEDLTKEFPYPENYFDYIYARLVLHYFSSQDLDKVLSKFRIALKKSGHLFVVVRSENKEDKDKPDTEYDPITRYTKVVYRDKEGNITGWGVRYFHTPETIIKHLTKAGFEVEYHKSYNEQLYIDFMRTKVSPRLDPVIEVHAN